MKWSSNLKWNKVWLLVVFWNNAMKEVSNPDCRLGIWVLCWYHAQHANVFRWYEEEARNVPPFIIEIGKYPFHCITPLALDSQPMQADPIRSPDDRRHNTFLRSQQPQHECENENSPHRYCSSRYNSTQQQVVLERSWSRFLFVALFLTIKNSDMGA